MNSDNGYKLKIKKELEKEQPDWALIEKLSSTVIDAKEDTLRFRVDAGHINKLGLELVGKQETALIELIKNAYDADATEVTVNFFNAEEEGGKLVIQDNGSGMNLETIKNAWMNISTDFKQENKISPKFERVRAGRKGIGRFSVQRLGKRLVLFSNVEGETKTTKVIFNWDVDYVTGVNIRDVYVSAEYIDKDVNTHGTTLEIFDLREVWKDNNLKKVWSGVLMLQSPFKPKTVKDNITFDPGFETIINKVSREEKRTELSIDSMFLDHALADITGSIDNNGVATVNLKSEILQLDETYTLENTYLLTGEVEFQTKYFIYLSNLMSINHRSASKLSEDYGGIRIYRNGFRVLPYGEGSDDWLKLDKDTSNRTLLIPGGNKNFFGAVYLDDGNILFEETSNREGLIENDAFKELSSFVRSAVQWAIVRVAAIRNRKQKSSQSNFTSELIPPKKPTEVIKDLQESLIEIASSEQKTLEQKNESINQKLEYAKAEIEKFEDVVEENKLASIQYEEMLRILASLGISLSIFGHEIKGAMDSLNGAITLLEMKLEKIKENESLLRTASSLRSVSDRILNVGKYIGNITAHNSSRTLKSLNINQQINDFFTQFQSQLDKRLIKYELNLSISTLQSIPMHESELISVLLNFTTNSIKYLKKSGVNNPMIQIITYLDGQYIVIRFEDNGTGIVEKDKFKIFDAFYTTSISDADELLDGVGTGLGLKIVSDIASSYGGSVKLVEPSVNFKCAFEFKILNLR